MRNFLIVSDLQIPFEAKYALQFAKQVKREFKIADEDCFNVGDEVDEYFGSDYLKDPDAAHTPNSELEESREKLRAWYSAFPKMKLAVSNHGIRWAKKASSAGIPSLMVKAYQEILEAPQGWRWQDAWLIKTRHPFQVIHGMGYSGMNGHRTAALDAGVSTAIGHLHSHAGVAVIRTKQQEIWGMNTGCLIDREAYAFKYGIDSRFKPCLGLGVVKDSGRSAIWIPYPYKE